VSYPPTVKSRFAGVLLLALLSITLFPSRQAHAAQPDEAAEADRLLARWAPVFVQHVAWHDGGRDRPTRFDFDGDWVATNNWKNQSRFGHRLPAHVYGSAVLTATHAYLSYYLFYPRDWMRPFCLPFVCHENDLEAVLVVVGRGPSAGASRSTSRGGPSEGELQLVETKPHWSYVGRTAAEVMLSADGRPVVRVQSQKHGTYPCAPNEDRCRPDRGRLLYTLAAPGAAPDLSPHEVRGQEVHYTLLPLHDTIWRHRSALAASSGAMWAAGEQPLRYAGSLQGRLGAPLGTMIAASVHRAGARPPWGLRAPVGARGDWFLDPAAVTLARYRLKDATAPGSRTYVHHPYLDDLRAECAGGKACAAREASLRAAASPPRVPATVRAPAAPPPAPRPGTTPPPAQAGPDSARRTAS
jgi:hypothetical protein